MTRARRASAALATGTLLFVFAHSATGQYGGGGGGGGLGPGVPGAMGSLATIPSQPAGGAQGSTVLPGVRSTLTVSDNLLLRPRGEEAAGFRAEIAPYVRASMFSPRAQGTLSYELRSIYSHADGNSDSALRHDLDAYGNALLVDDWLGIQGTARTFRTSTSPFGVVGVDPATSNVNTSRVSSVSMTPYVQGRMSSFAAYRAQYTLTRTDVPGSASNIVGRQNEQVMASLRSGPQFSRWGWALSSSGSRFGYGNGLQLHSASTVGTLYYVFGPELRVGLSANYAYFERLTNDKGENRGWGPGLDIDWVPQPRTTLRLNLVDQYYGSTANLSLAHRTERWTFGLNYSRSVLSSNNAGILTMSLDSLLSGNAYSSALNPVFQQLVSQGVINPNNILIGAGILSDALVRQRMISASIGYLMPRGSLALTGYRNIRQTLLDSTIFLPASDPLITSAFGQFETVGGMLTLSMPFDSRSSAFVSGSMHDISSLDSPDRARLSSLTVSMHTRLDSKIGMTTGVRRTVQAARGGGVGGYDENAVFGTLDLRF